MATYVFFREYSGDAMLLPHSILSRMEYNYAIEYVVVSVMSGLVAGVLIYGSLVFISYVSSRLPEKKEIISEKKHVRILTSSDKRDMYVRPIQPQSKSREISDIFDDMWKK